MSRDMILNAYLIVIDANPHKSLIFYLHIYIIIFYIIFELYFIPQIYKLAKFYTYSTAITPKFKLKLLTANFNRDFNCSYE